MVRALTVLLAFFLSAPSRALSEAPGRPSPAASMNAVYEQVRSIVAAERDNTPEEKINEKLKKIITPMFDFEELTRRSVGSYWSRGSAAEQRELVALLSDLLARTYLKRITRGVELIKVEELSEEVDGDRATVTAVVSAKEVMVTTQAKLHYKPEGWKIWDVKVEGIGLVNNYRNEFPGIVRKEGFAGLIARLKKKRESQGGALPIDPSQVFSDDK